MSVSVSHEAPARRKPRECRCGSTAFLFAEAAAQLQHLRQCRCCGNEAKSEDFEQVTGQIEAAKSDARDRILCDSDGTRVPLLVWMTLIIDCTRYISIPTASHAITYHYSLSVSPGEIHLVANSCRSQRRIKMPTRTC